MVKHVYKINNLQEFFRHKGETGLVPRAIIAPIDSLKARRLLRKTLKSLNEVKPYATKVSINFEEETPVTTARKSSSSTTSVAAVKPLPKLPGSSNTNNAAPRNDAIKTQLQSKLEMRLNRTEKPQPPFRNEARVPSASDDSDDDYEFYENVAEILEARKAAGGDVMDDDVEEIVPIPPRRRTIKVNSEQKLVFLYFQFYLKV